MNEYVTFHNNVEKMVPALKETASPAEISQREAALGATLIKQRPDAKEGDFFIKEYQPYLRQIIKADFAKRSLVDRKALIVELPKGLKVGVNMVYPTTLPLATFPGNLSAGTSGVAKRAGIPHCRTVPDPARRDRQRSRRSDARRIPDSDVRRGGS